MATAQARLTLATNRTPAVINVPAGELSGAQWVSRWPTSRDIADLNEPFRGNVNAFLGAVSAAGGSTRVSATFRPEERAWLMHYSYEVAMEVTKPENVPARAGININWVHPTEAQSIAAAEAMRVGYEMVHPAAIVSQHTAHLAIDMTISGMIGQTIINQDGTSVTILRNSDLFPVGASHGVIKLVSDPLHWSSNGH